MKQYTQYVYRDNAWRAVGSIPILPDGVYHINVSGTGSSWEPDRCAALWYTTVNDSRISSLTDGLSISLKIPSVDESGGQLGVLLNINSLGYHPVVYDVNTSIGDKYSIGSTIILTYNASQTATAYYNSSTETTYTGCWQIVGYEAATEEYVDDSINTLTTNIQNNKNLAKGIEYIVGTQDEATNAWTGVSTDTGCSNSTLYIGKIIMYHLPVAGNSSAATLNLTLPDGTTTGAKTIYRLNNSTVTTTFAAGCDILMIWNGTNWKVNAYVDSNTNTIAYQVRGNSALFANKTGYSSNRYTLLFQVDGGLSGAATTIGTGTSKVTVPFKYIPNGLIKYYSVSGAIAANANFSASGLWDKYTVNLGYTFNTGATLTSGLPVYMRCGVNSDGTLTPNYAGSPSHPIVQALPNSEDGYVYVYLGHAYSTTNIELELVHPIYEYKNGKIREWQYDNGLATSYTHGTVSGEAQWDSTNDQLFFSIEDSNTNDSNGLTIATNGAGLYSNGASVWVDKYGQITLSSGLELPSLVLNATDGVFISKLKAPTENDHPATKKYVDDAITALPEPMIFKGSLGTGGTITSLPTASSSNEGFTYKVITAGTYASQSAKIGDTFISDGSSWVLIPSGDEPSGTVTSITLNATSPINIDSSSAITTSGTRTLSHANSGVTAGTYKSVTVNATGHVTAGTNPTTLSGYGITDAKIENGTITLGSNTITPLTSEVNDNLINGSATGSLKTVTTATATIGVGAFQQGYQTAAAADYSHAEGYGSVIYSNGYGAHAEGWGTCADSPYQHVEGKWNEEDSLDTYAHIVGNGTDVNTLSNAYTLDWNGNGWFAGDVYVGSTSGTNKDAGSKKLLKEGDVTDTKNTAGSTDTSSKIYIIGATSQAANPQTYSQDTAYVGTDGHLYSNSKQVVNLSDTQSLTNKTYNGLTLAKATTGFTIAGGTTSKTLTVGDTYTLGAACAKGVDTSITETSTSTNLPTTAAVVTYVNNHTPTIDNASATVAGVLKVRLDDSTHTLYITNNGQDA